MSCDEYQRGISAMMDAPSDGPEGPALFAHLAGCSECRKFFVVCRRTERALLEAPEMPAALDGAIRRSCAGAGSGLSTGRLLRRWRGVLAARVRVPAPALGLAALVMLVLLLRAFAGSSAGGWGGKSVVYVPTLPEVHVEAASLQVDPQQERR